MQISLYSPSLPVNFMQGHPSGKPEHEATAPPRVVSSHNRPLHSLSLTHTREIFLHHHSLSLTHTVKITSATVTFTSVIISLGQPTLGILESLATRSAIESSPP